MTIDKTLRAGLVPFAMLLTATATHAADKPPAIILAQAQKTEPPLTEEEKKKRELQKLQQQQKPPPKAPSNAQQPPQKPTLQTTTPPPKTAQPPTLQKTPGPPPQQPATTTPPPSNKQATTPLKPPSAQPSTKPSLVTTPPTPPSQPPSASNKIPPPPPVKTTQPPPQKPADKTIVAPKTPETPPPKTAAPTKPPTTPSASTTPPPKSPPVNATTPPATVTTTPPPKTATPPVTTTAPPATLPPTKKDTTATKPPAIPAVAPPTTQQTGLPIEKRKLTAPPPPKLEAIQKNREQRVEDNGKRLVVQEPNGRIIVKQDNRIIIQHNETERFSRLPNAQTNRRGDIVETFYVRPDGVRVITEVDSRGQLLRRYRRAPDGREFAIIDNRRFVRNAVIGVGITALAAAVAINLPPPRVAIPRERYIVEYERASTEDIYEALSAPPVEKLERSYSLEEVRYGHSLRERMRRIDLDINFETGSAEVTPDQFPKLERLARVILRVLERHPEEVYLIEGHTDAVGSEIDNLSLSDRRAEAVAHVLTDVFNIPPENLVTQGYGEQFQKVPTLGPERLNRRVAMRRIGPLLAERQ
jgi:outer membrane protein OmpA-like peptidoglycan-associated protein